MKVYRYACRRNFTNAELVLEQLRLAARLRNDLVEVERARYGACRAEIDAVPEVAAARSSLQALCETLPPCATLRECSDYRDGRDGKTLCPSCVIAQPARAAVATARKLAWKAVDSARDALDDHPDVQALTTAATLAPKSYQRKFKARIARARNAVAVEMSARPDATLVQRLVVTLDEIEARVRAFASLTCARSGLGRGAWGTVALVRAAVKAARKSGRKPHFKRFDGTGRVGVQLQSTRSLTVQGALDGNDSRLRLEPPTPEEWGQRKRQPGTQDRMLRLRVNSDGRAPVWASWPVVLHRLPPLDAQIKWAYVVCENVGASGEHGSQTRCGDFRWWLHLEVDEAPPARPVAPEGRVAVDGGWRMRPDGARVAYWEDDTGKHDEIVLPERFFDDLDHARSVGAVRRRLFDEFLPFVAAWVQAQEALPEWFGRATTTLPSWISPDRLAHLAWRWQHNRFAGDEEVFGPHDTCPKDQNGVLNCTAHVECWRRKDLELARWSAGETRRVLAFRNATYRNIAALLADHYRTLLLGRFDLRGVVGRAGLPADASDGDKVKADNSSARRHAVAPSILRLALINAFRTRGGEVRRVSDAYKTQDCAECGLRNDFDASLAIDHRCTGCGATWDQDRNHVRNHLAASSPVAPPDGEVLADGKRAKRCGIFGRRAQAGAPRVADAAGCSQGDVQRVGFAPEVSGAVGRPAQEV